MPYDELLASAPRAAGAYDGVQKEEGKAFLMARDQEQAQAQAQAGSQCRFSAPLRVGARRVGWRRNEMKCPAVSFFCEHTHTHMRALQVTCMFVLSGVCVLCGSEVSRKATFCVCMHTRRKVYSHLHNLPSKRFHWLRSNCGASRAGPPATHRRGCGIDHGPSRPQCSADERHLQYATYQVRST